MLTGVYRLHATGRPQRRNATRMRARQHDEATIRGMREDRSGALDLGPSRTSTGRNSTCNDGAMAWSTTRGRLNEAALFKCRSFFIGRGEPPPRRCLP